MAIVAAMPMARVTAPSAAPERAWYRARSRRASLIEIVAREAAAARARMASGARKRSPMAVQTVPPRMKPVPVLVSEGEQDDAGTEQDAAESGEAVGRLRAGRTPRQGGHDRRSGPRSRAGHHAARTAVTKVRTMAAATRPPRQGETVDAVLGERLQRRYEREPRGQSDGRADDGGGGSDRGAVGQHDQADVAVGRAERAEHAEGPQSPLGHHREAGHGHQADEQQPERAEHQHHGLGRDLVGGAAAPRCRCRRRSAGGTTGGSAGRR